MKTTADNTASFEPFIPQPPSPELAAFFNYLVDDPLNTCGVLDGKPSYKIGPGYDPNEVKIQGEAVTVTPKPITFREP